MKIIKTKCIKVARESLESLLEQKLPRLAASNVFDHLIADWGQVEEDCRFEEYQDEDFGVLHTTYWSLVQIFTAIRCADGGVYCDKHNINNINSKKKPEEENVKEIHRAIFEFSLDEFWKEDKSLRGIEEYNSLREIEQGSSLASGQ